MSATTRLFALVALIGSLAFGAAGVQPASAQDDADPVALTTVRFVNAVPDGPAIDITVDDKPVVTNLAYGAVSDTATVEPGDSKIRVTATGDTAGDAIVESDTGFDEGGAYIVTIHGKLGDVDAKVNEIDLDGVDSGKARVRLINGSVDADNSSIQIVGGDTLFEDVDTGGDSTYNDVDAGTYELQIRIGDDDTPVGTISLQADAGSAYDIVEYGMASDGSISGLIIATNVSTPCGEVLGLSDTTDACVRVINANPELATIDATIEANVAAKDLTFGSASDFVTVASGGDQSIDVAAAGEIGTDSAESDKASFDPGQAYEIVIWSNADAATVTTEVDIQIDVHEVDLTSVPEGRARVRFIQTSGDAGDVDVIQNLGADTEPVKLFDDVHEGDATDYEVVDAGTSDIESHFNGEDAAFYTATGAQFETGMVYDIVALGRVDGDTFTLLILSAPAEPRSDTESTPVATPLN